jgi:hypothetical protein
LQGALADVGQRRRVEQNGADHIDGLDKLKVIRSEIEMLVIGNCILYKDRQNPNLIVDFRNAFDPD